MQPARERRLGLRWRGLPRPSPRLCLMRRQVSAAVSSYSASRRALALPGGRGARPPSAFIAGTQQFLAARLPRRHGLKRGPPAHVEVIVMTLSQRPRRADSPVRRSCADRSVPCGTSTMSRRTPGVLPPRPRAAPCTQAPAPARRQPRPSGLPYPVPARRQPRPSGLPNPVSAGRRPRPSGVPYPRPSRAWPAITRRPGTSRHAARPVTALTPLPGRQPYGVPKVCVACELRRWLGLATGHHDHRCPCACSTSSSSGSAAGWSCSAGIALPR